MIHFVASILAFLLWIPIMMRFRGQWSARGNPISLAIVGHVAWVMLLATTPFWLSQGVPPESMMAAHEVLALIVILFYFVSFWMADRKFPNARDR